MNTVQFCVGIDVSKDSLECSYGLYSEFGELQFSKVQKFTNDLKGFKKLLEWLKKKKDPAEIFFVMEATGVYYENLAYWLQERDFYLSVVLPNKVNYFAKSHNIKTKTDSVDAKLLCRMGLERKLDHWEIPSLQMRTLKILTRDYRSLKAKLTMTKNQLHAKDNSHKCPPTVGKRLKQQIQLLEKQISQVESEIKLVVRKDSILDERIRKMETIPGVGFMTIACILGETNAFALVRNSKQLVSYCGFDIQHRQSGLYAGKTTISKKGNSFIRSALYMPALSSLQHNPNLKIFYNRLSEKKSIKKIAVTAVARKLLVLIYTIWKNGSEYNPDYLFSD
ncbi:IS110 family transposase [Antarcticibacterium sp. 1MA-6-2]|uniref:IS110 family transposase n=1 Tax=Antarcticibacterium sp. 1MA-6-2 TaxID=2908210 RepID=UPI001F41B53C|nr:IS110 family transposase [Antarcticibacterium sp. 1MA-6-2]UJH89673.1 IS110 family transposase [Antarcticibacterium sp. 1MA-6-2]UJH90007.1 IS110 family transposase [Antarcticibacterium sp. 1MA-6-2]UJH91946.1 IS110 family transposase [Antarcticibacterium sp. 1MA-6-2]UJH92315.1 IS110 family transposase [Antarcticibacterium sp. 1MA-6-2]UJH92697.1 IS110 family transposase [Antarcticibacterium sp. 1MA-6-2]